MHEPERRARGRAHRRRHRGGDDDALGASLFFSASAGLGTRTEIFSENPRELIFLVRRRRFAARRDPRAVLGRRAQPGDERRRDAREQRRRAVPLGGVDNRRRLEAVVVPALERGRAVFKRAVFVRLAERRGRGARQHRARLLHRQGGHRVRRARRGRPGLYGARDADGARVFRLRLALARRRILPAREHEPHGERRRLREPLEVFAQIHEVSVGCRESARVVSPLDGRRVVVRRRARDAFLFSLLLLEKKIRRRVFSRVEAGDGDGADARVRRAPRGLARVYDDHDSAMQRRGLQEPREALRQVGGVAREGRRDAECPLQPRARLLQEVRGVLREGGVRERVREHERGLPVVLVRLRGPRWRFRCFARSRSRLELRRRTGSPSGRAVASRVVVETVVGARILAPAASQPVRQHRELGGLARALGAGEHERVRRAQRRDVRSEPRAHLGPRREPVAERVPVPGQAG